MHMLYQSRAISRHRACTRGRDLESSRVRSSPRPNQHSLDAGRVEIPKVAQQVMALTAASVVALCAGTSNMLIPPLARAAVSPEGLVMERQVTQQQAERTKLGIGAPKQDDDLLDEEELANVKVFKDNTPSVVNVTNLRAFQDNRYSMNIESIPVGLGSGFIWDKDGHVVTNYHVVQGSTGGIRVTLFNQETYPAKLIGFDPDKDVAVLKLDIPDEKAKRLRPVELREGDVGSLLVGQKVYAIGNPFGLDHTLTQGIISGLGRQLNAGMLTIKDVIQTDASINPGNSGGVLLDSRGRVIGINTAIADPTGKGSSSGVGFAIPISMAKGLVTQILQYGRVTRPALGIGLAPPALAQQLNLDGVLVLSVPPNSPAGKAGMRGTYRNADTGSLVLGDCIIGVEGTPVKTFTDLYDALDEKRPGDVVQIQVLRQGGSIKSTLRIVLGERAVGQPAAGE